MIWTDAEDQILRDGHGKMPMADIAKQIGGGCTRNAVIGRARRIGLPNIRQTYWNYRGRRPRVERAPKIRRIVIPIAARTRDEDLAIPQAQRRTLEELTEQTCRWPVGHVDQPGFFFCGAKPFATRPYCAGHCAVAYESFRCVVDDEEQHAATPAAA